MQNVEKFSFILDGRSQWSNISSPVTSLGKTFSHLFLYSPYAFLISHIFKNHFPQNEEKFLEKWENVEESGKTFFPKWSLLIIFTLTIHLCIIIIHYVWKRVIEHKAKLCVSIKSIEKKKHKEKTFNYNQRGNGKKLN